MKMALPVHDQSCEECTYDAFQAHRLAEGRTHEEYRHDEDELHHGITIASQEPSRQTRDGQQQHDGEDGELRQEPHPEEESTTRLVRRHQCCQADECQQQRQHRPTHAQCHAGLALQAIATNDGVGDERVRCHQRTQQERCLVAVAEEPSRREIGEDERREERQQSEERHARDVLSQAIHVHLQCCQEHDVVESDLSKQLERCVALQDVQSIFSYQHTRQHHANDVGDAQLTHDDRC